MDRSTLSNPLSNEAGGHVAYGKPQYAAIPNRALWDREISDRDVRNLAVIAAHDRLSHARGKGQGAWASHKRFAALAGTEYSRFSVSVNRLLARGYLSREQLASDRRKFTYRVIYTDEDSLPSSQELLPEIVCSDANEVGQIVCSEPQLSGCILDESSAQYISQSEVIDSAEAVKINSPEAVKINSPEGARFAARNARQDDYCTNVGAELGKLERALKANEIGADDLKLWLPWLEGVSEADYGYPINGWAGRLIEDCHERLELINWESGSGAAGTAWGGGRREYLEGSTGHQRHPTTIINVQKNGAE